jgi:hypothetical protein
VFAGGICVAAQFVEPVESAADFCRSWVVPRSAAWTILILSHLLPAAHQNVLRK